MNKDDATPETGTAPSVGGLMPDGTIYAGTSPDTGKAMYTTPADAPLTYTFNEAQKYAAMLDANGHQDWRVPTKSELSVLFDNRSVIGGFNEDSSTFAGWYWSSSQLVGNYAWDERFSDRYLLNDSKEGVPSLRCVRG